MTTIIHPITDIASSPQNQAMLDLQNVDASAIATAQPWHNPGFEKAQLVLMAARLAAAAATDPPTFLVRVNPKGSGEDAWVTFKQHTASDQAGQAPTISSPVSAGATLIPVSATTGFSPGDTIYIQDKGDINNSQFAVVHRVNAGVSLNILEPLKAAKTTADIVTNGAQSFFEDLDLTAVARLKVDFLNTGTTTSAYHVQALMSAARVTGGA